MTDFELLGKAYGLLQQVFEYSQTADKNGEFPARKERLKEKEEAGGIVFEVLVTNCHDFIESKNFSQAVNNSGDDNWFELVSETRRIVCELKKDLAKGIDLMFLWGTGHWRELEKPMRQLKIIWETAEFNKVNSVSSVPEKKPDANKKVIFYDINSGIGSIDGNGFRLGDPSDIPRIWFEYVIGQEERFPFLQAQRDLNPKLDGTNVTHVNAKLKRLTRNDLIDTNSNGSKLDKNYRMELTALFPNDL